MSAGRAQELRRECALDRGGWAGMTRQPNIIHRRLDGAHSGLPASTLISTVSDVGFLAILRHRPHHRYRRRLVSRLLLTG